MTRYGAWPRSVFACAWMIGFMGFATAQQVVVNTKTVVSPSGETLEIAEWTDNARRSKYSVINPKLGSSGPRWWFAENGSDNAGRNEAGRRTSNQEWCRVRYIYGDNVRIPECWGGFMYSSHLITGIDGMHYELWFSPSSLSYFKIRNQESGVWYAHDGSANDGRQKTTKDDWCRVIFYHMLGIVKLPDECRETQSRIVGAIASEGTNAQATELMRVKRMMGEAGREKEVVARANPGAAEPPAGVEFAKDRVQDVGQAGLEMKFDKVASGRLAYDKLNYTRPGGLKVMSSSSVRGQAAQVGSGIVVGIAVDYGVDTLKDRLGWRAKDANAGMIAAETITTTVASTALTTAIMTTVGATFNPVAVGVGLVLSGAIAGGEEIKKASEDTGIRFEDGFEYHPRYARDLNGIHATLFAPRLLDSSYDWEECASEGGRCEFGGYRSVRYGAGDRWAYKTFLGAVDCGVAAFGSDPAPNVVKHCEAPVYRGENLNFVNCAREGERCAFSGTRVVAYGANQSWFEKEISDGATCSYTVFGDPAPGVAKTCAVFLHKNEVPRWVSCAGEGQTCNLPGKRIVRYGTAGAWNETTATDSIACSYRNLGDPKPGVSKGCEVKLTSGELRKWQDCGGEGQKCAFTGVRVVRYGVAGQFNFRIAKDGLTCDYRVLGDPRPGVAKRCSVQVLN